MPATIQGAQLRIAYKNPCRLATTADHGLSGLTDIDGVTPVDGDRILVRLNSSGDENGIYLAASGAWVRAEDMDDSAAGGDQVTAGLSVYIQEGTANAQATYTLTTTGTIVIDTTSLTFAQNMVVTARSNIYYVGKHGSDSNDGKAPETAFLTIGQATTDINTNETPSTTNRFEIQIMDAGRYVEAVVLADWTSLIAPTATVAPAAGAGVTMGDGSVVNLARIETTGVGVGFSNTADEGWANVDEILVLSGTNPGVSIQGGTLYLTARRIIMSSTGSGVLASTVGIGIIDVGEIEVTTGIGLQVGGTTVTVTGRIAKITDTGAGTGLDINASTSGKVELVVGLIDCTTTYAVGTGNTLSMFVSDLVGSVGTINGTANVSEASSAANSDFLPTILSTTEKTATFTAAIGEMHLVDLSGGSFTANLPAVADAGRIAFLVTSTGGQLTLDPNGAETIDGKSTTKVSTGANTIEDDGTQWRLIQKTGRNPLRLDPAQITSDQNNYNPTDWGSNVTHTYIDSSATWSITGVEEDGFVEMDSVTIVNDGSNDIIFAHDASTSTVANRILIGGGASFTLVPNGVLILLRDGTVNKWRLYPVGEINDPAPVTQTNAVYVSKAGSDSNDGTDATAPKLTLGSAITQAGTMSPGATNRIAIIVQDAGTYVENTLTLGTYQDLFAPEATLQHGNVSVSPILNMAGDEGQVVRVHKLAAGGTGAHTGLNYTGTGHGNFYADEVEILSTNGAAYGIQVGGSRRLIFQVGKIKVQNGTAIVRQNVGAGNFSGDVDEIEITGSGTGVFLYSACLADFRIGRIFDAGAGTGITVNTGASTVSVVIGEINCNTTYAVGTSATLNMFVGSLTGSLGTINGTANVSVAGAGGGDVTGPGSSIDNSIPRFDSTTGKLLQGGVASNNVILTDTGDLHPEASDGGALGGVSNRWSDLYLSTGAVINMNGIGITATSADIMDFTGASTGFRFDGPVIPQTNDLAGLGNVLRQWSDLFLASGGVVNWDNGDVTATHAAGTLTFAGAANGFKFSNPVVPTTNDLTSLGTSNLKWSDLFLASGSVISWDIGDVTLTHSANALTFAGAASGYGFDTALFLTERAAALTDQSGKGQIWVRTDNTLMFTDEAGADTALGQGTGDVSGPGSSIDNALPRFDSTTGKLLQGGVASNNVILNDTGDLHPEVSDGGQLGTASLHWSDLRLASGGVIDFSSGDVTLTHSANTLTFAGATSGYRLNDGNLFTRSIFPDSANTYTLGSTTFTWADLFLGLGSVLNWDNGDVTLTHSANTLAFAGASEGYNFDNVLMLTKQLNSAVSNPTGSNAMLYPNADQEAIPHLVWRSVNHSMSNSREYNLLSNLRNCILHTNQLAQLFYVSQATAFWITLAAALDSANPDTFVISDGTTTETYTAVVTESSAFDFAVGANAAASLANLAQAITDDSAKWGAVFISNADLPLHAVHTSANNGMIVIWNLVQTTAGEDRIYGDFSNQARVFHVDFDGHPDYRAISDNAKDSALASTDPGSRTFGFGTTAMHQGDLFTSILDRKISVCNRFDSGWDTLVSPGSVSGSGTTNRLAYWDTTTSVAAASSLQLSGNDLLLTGGHIRLDSDERYEWGAGGAYIQADADNATGDMVFHSRDDFVFEVGGSGTDAFFLTSDYTLATLATGSLPPNQASYGQFWTKNTSPNVPMFTPSGTLDHRLVGFDNNTTTADHRITRFDGSTGSYVIGSAVSITDAGDIIPATTVVQDLGGAANRWQNLYLGNADIDFTNTLEFRTAGTLLWSMSTAGVLESAISTASIGLGSAGNVKFQTPDGSAMVLNPVSDVVIQVATTEWMRFDSSAREVTIKDGSSNLAYQYDGVLNQLWLGNNAQINTDYASVLRLCEASNQYIGGYFNYDGSANRMIIGRHSAGDTSTASDIEVMWFERNSNAIGIAGGSQAVFAPAATLDIKSTLSSNVFKVATSSTATSKTLCWAEFSNDASIETGSYWWQFRRSSSTFMGGIRGNNDGTTVVYATFAGHHDGYNPGSTFTNNNVNDGTREWERGMILCSNGNRCTDGVDTAEEPEVVLATTALDKTVVGIYQNAVASGVEQAGMNDSLPVADYAAVGHALILVTDEDGNVDNGDLVTTSGVSAGYGKLQADDILHSYTVAKVTEQVDWSSITDTVDGNKYALLACFVYCG